MKHLFLISIISIFISLGAIRTSFAIEIGEGFTEIVSEHFRARFLTPSDRELARQALERADYFYGPRRENEKRDRFLSWEYQ